MNFYLHLHVINPVVVDSTMSSVNEFEYMIDDYYNFKSHNVIIVISYSN